MRVLHSGSPSLQLTNLIELLRILGLNVDVVDIAGSPISPDSLAEWSNHGLVLDAASLKNSAGAAESIRLSMATAGTNCALLFVTDAAECTSEFLNTVTNGVIEGTRLSTGKTANFSRPIIPAARQLAGSNYLRRNEPALTLSGHGIDSILQICGEPSFGVVRGNSAPSLFIWSTLTVFDMTQPLSSELEFERAVDEYVPAIVYARSVAGRSIWHNPSPLATLIIDDPLLQPRYGHIDFPCLLESARDHAYSVALAFIPWNHWRTRKRNAAIFNEYSDVFSLCVHGNDHTAAEFESGDHDELRSRAEQAIVRMESHRDRISIGYAPVMVCPQERYSVKALEAIAASGHYLAVANSRLIPNVPEAAGRVTGADLLQPAMDAWSSCALLKRHYPGDGMEKIALTLFLGRPLILSEHHNYFSDGTEKIETLVQDLKRLDPELTWKPLGHIVRSLRWQRQSDDATWHIRFFSDELVLPAPPIERRNYKFERRVHSALPITAVSAHGGNVNFRIEDDQVRFELSASELVKVSLDRSIRPADTRYGTTYKHRANVALRRVLSELRDRASARVDRAKSLLRLTSGSRSP